MMKTGSFSSSSTKVHAINTRHFAHGGRSVGHNE